MKEMINRHDNIHTGLTKVAEKLNAPKPSGISTNKALKVGAGGLAILGGAYGVKKLLEKKVPKAHDRLFKWSSWDRPGAKGITSWSSWDRPLGR